MSLTGHLDVFPLEEILRLLARSYKSGCLRVDSPDLHGRVYLNNGSLALATIGSDEDLRRQLIASKLVGDDTLRSAEVGGKSLNDVAADNGRNDALGDFFREEVVESLYRIRKPGRGQFVFNVDVAPRYRADTAFDVELCVSEADRRAAEWADIESVIPSIDLSLRIIPEAPNGEPVTLAPNTWRLVAGFEGSATVRSLADRLGSSRFRVAKDLTGLIRSGLVEAAIPVVVAAEPEPLAPAVIFKDEPTQAKADSPEFGWRESLESVPDGAMQPEPAVQPQYPSGDSERREFLAPEPELEPVLQQGYEQPEENKDFGSVDSHDQGWWTEPAEAEDPSGADDPVAEEPVVSDKPTQPGDTFLDRVFSQLEENPEGQGSSHGISHGFLKRRRMSSIGLDE